MLCILQKEYLKKCIEHIYCTMKKFIVIFLYCNQCSVCIKASQLVLAVYRYLFFFQK
jgi:hypothetical protein